MPISRLWLHVLAVVLAVTTLTAPALAEDAAPPGDAPPPPPVFAQHPDFDPGAGVSARADGQIHVDGRAYDLRSDGAVHSGMFVPDGRGGYVWLGSGDTPPMPDPSLEDARELRLRIRELADQLLGGGAAASLKGMIALPASFVSQDDLERSSSFGRLVAEQMFHEFSLRGVSVREYHALPMLETRPGDGDFALTRDPTRLADPPAGALVLAGTYYHDEHSVFVNARLFRATDHLVLRTAQVVMPQTETTRVMLAKGTGIRLHSAEYQAKSYAQMKERPDIGAVLMEEDLH